MLKVTKRYQIKSNVFTSWNKTSTNNWHIYLHRYTECQQLEQDTKRHVKTDRRWRIHVLQYTIYVLHTKKNALEYNHHKREIVETESNAHSNPILKLKS
jgi:hypothetical protein